MKRLFWLWFFSFLFVKSMWCGFITLRPPWSYLQSYFVWQQQKSRENTWHVVLWPTLVVYNRILFYNSKNFMGKYGVGKVSQILAIYRVITVYLLWEGWPRYALISHFVQESLGRCHSRLSSYAVHAVGPGFEPPAMRKNFSPSLIFPSWDAFFPHLPHKMVKSFFFFFRYKPYLKININRSSEWLHFLSFFCHVN